ncbi:MAG: outer membrane protein assembly factor BamA [Betaproteobacteria bacterium]|nr:outer membrane protein assembly factor BamA [Betaproteobacteria bacterium]
MTKRFWRTRPTLLVLTCMTVLFAALLLRRHGALASEAEAAPKVVEIKVQGNRAVQSEAVLGLMETKVGGELTPEEVSDDIRSIFNSGYFRDVRVDAQTRPNGVALLVVVDEKPSVKEIRFTGFDAISSSTVSEKLLVKKYTILDERKITSDLRLIEQLYVEKGYYLARASYSVEEVANTEEVVLTYQITENNPVWVSHVNFIGNAFFGDTELKSNMATREKRWSSWLTNSGAFKDEFVNRDKEFLAYIYRDNGYAEANVSSPQSRLDSGRQTVDVSFNIDEGERFRVGSVTITGDLLLNEKGEKIYSEADLLEKLNMKTGKWFRISQFQNDMRMITDLYGDHGFAFVDVLPKTRADSKEKKIDIEFAITKGEKVYFRNIVVEGNAKTRDNVIRRNIKVAEGELFHATRLEKSKAAIERLGYFQEVQITREPDVRNKRMDLRVKVKEKSTGTLSASFGASPSSDTRSINFFAQGSYSEANLLGKGWNAGLSANYSPTGSYSLNINLTEPSWNDGPWSVTGFASFEYELSRPIAFESERFSKTVRGGLNVGREIIEDLRVSGGYSLERVTRNNVTPIGRLFTKQGTTEKLSQSVSFDKTDNYLMPTSGFSLSATNSVAIKGLAGTNQFGLAELAVNYYVPLFIGEDFKTNFRFVVEPTLVYPIQGSPIPYWERLNLGTLYNMKAYYQEEKVIGPRIEVVNGPFAQSVDRIVVGGNRRLYGAGEYFIPLIPEANLRLVSFWESGTVLDDNESLSMEKFKHDLGFGLRWQTPIAPFRFEWAWPLEKGRLGEQEFIFSVGNDNVSSLTR